MDKKKKLLIIGGAVTVVLIAVIVCIIIFAKGEKKIDEEITTVPETTVVETTTADPYAGMERSFLTGEYISEKRASKRPVAVMYNNIINAIPHSGISNADVLYEAPVEGSITRIMGIFDNYSKLKKIGSVRSCRIYYCYFALEWDAIYCHFGQSKYAKSFLQSGDIDTVGSLTAGNNFYRTSDRVAPHNCFISGKSIDEGIKKLEYRKKYKDDYSGHFQFADVDTVLELNSEKIANKVQLGYPINKPWFEYNAQDGQYYRFQYGEKHIDDQNNEQLHCSNIIIQFVDNTMYPDGKSLNIKLTGSGKGWFVTKGKAQKITWQKDKKQGQTKYFDAEGNEITLNNGKTWICIVQNSYSDNVKISK